MVATVDGVHVHKPAPPPDVSVNVPAPVQTFNGPVIIDGLATMVIA
jgi:hypothetical protein